MQLCKEGFLEGVQILWRSCGTCFDSHMLRSFPSASLVSCLGLLQAVEATDAADAADATGSKMLLLLNIMLKDACVVSMLQ